MMCIYNRRKEIINELLIHMVRRYGQRKIWRLNAQELCDKIQLELERGQIVNVYVNDDSDHRRKKEV